MTRMKSSVGVILVNYNGYRFTVDCIASLLASDHQQLRIYVVDNGSESTEVARLKKHYSDKKQVVLIFLSPNRGLVKANNEGISQAIDDGCDYVWILNNDTLVRQDALSLMLQAFDIHHLSHEDAVLTSILTFKDPTLVWSNGMYDLPLFNFPKSIDKNKKTDSIAQPGLVLKRVTHASSVSLLVHADFVRKHGMLPDEYFIYYDDLDWSSRGEVYSLQQPLVQHLVSATGGKQGSDGFTPFKAYWNGRNAILYYFKRKRITVIEKAIFLILTTAVMTLLYIRDFKTLRSYWRGIGDGLWQTTY